MDNLYNYRIIDYKVIDGDTVDLTIDLGFNIHHKSRFRLYGINAPERNRKDVWSAAKGYLNTLLTEYKDSLIAVTFKDKKDKYGRYLVSIQTTDGYDINLKMVSAGFAVEYHP